MSSVRSFRPSPSRPRGLGPFLSPLAPGEGLSLTLSSAPFAAFTGRGMG